eukprot:1559735-Prymnesium_polylepis.1
MGRTSRRPFISAFALITSGAFARKVRSVSSEPADARCADGGAASTASTSACSRLTNRWRTPSPSATCGSSACA